MSPVNRLIGQLLVDAGSWEQPEAAAHAQLQLGLLLELHNRPRSWDLYDEYLPLALRVVEFPEADQAGVVRALERLVREAPTEEAATSLLSALGNASPLSGMEPALRLLVDPPALLTDGESWRRVMWVVDHLLDFVELPDDDPRRAALEGVLPIIEHFAPEEQLERVAAQGSRLASKTATSILRKLTLLRGETWQERIPAAHAGGELLEELLAGVHAADFGRRQRALAALTRLLGKAEGERDESNEPVDERYRHLTLDYRAQQYVVKELERALLGDVEAGERIAVLGALRRAKPHLALSLLFWIVAEGVARSWDAGEILALLDALDEQLRKVAALHDDDADWGVRNGADMALGSLHRMSLSETAPVRERAASVVDALRTFQHLPNGAQNRE